MERFVGGFEEFMPCLWKSVMEDHRRGGMVDQKEQVEQNDGHEAFNPEAFATVWARFCLKVILQSPWKGEPSRDKVGELINPGVERAI